MLNDGLLMMEFERMVFWMGDFVIQGLKVIDMGFYLCCLYYIEWKVLIVGVYFLYVRVDYGVILVIQGREIYLQCYVYLLGVLYFGFVKSWF